MSWFELKQLLYLVLTLCGVALLVASFPTTHSHDPVAQLCGCFMLLVGAGLLIFGLVTYLCREDWEIWS
jgi:hypothetical protein